MYGSCIYDVWYLNFYYKCTLHYHLTLHNDVNKIIYLIFYLVYLKALLNFQKTLNLV